MVERRADVVPGAKIDQPGAFTNRSIQAQVTPYRSGSGSGSGSGRVVGVRQKGLPIVLLAEFPAYNKVIYTPKRWFMQF